MEYTREWRVTVNINKCAVEDEVCPVNFSWKWEDDLSIVDQYTYSTLPLLWMSKDDC